MRDLYSLAGLDGFLPFWRRKARMLRGGELAVGGMLRDGVQGSLSPLSSWAVTWRGQAGCCPSRCDLGYLLKVG